MAKEKVENEKLVAILSYFLIGIIWYFVDEKMKKSAFAKFHVKQALVFTIISSIVIVVGTIIPVLGWFVILPLGGIAMTILGIMGIINAINLKTKELPVIGKYAKKFKF